MSTMRWTADVKVRTVGLLLLAMAVMPTCGVDADEAASEPSGTVAAPGDRQALLDFYHRFREVEPEVVRSMLSEDARWLNAFGRVLVGRDAIVDWYIHLLANPGYAVSHVSRQEDPEIRFLRPDVAIIHEYHEREGQVIDGVVTPTRKINTTYVLTIEDGRWLVRDIVTMDERSRPTPPPPVVASPPAGGR